MSAYLPLYEKMFQQAMEFLALMNETGLDGMDSLSPRDALKEIASQNGIPDGKEMGAFVAWAEEKLFPDMPSKKRK